MKITKSLLYSIIAEEIDNITNPIQEAMSSDDVATRVATFVDDIIEAGASESQVRAAVAKAISVRGQQKKEQEAANRKDIQEMHCGDDPHMPEPTHHDEDHEGNMAKRQMFKTAEYAAIIYDMLNDDENLPAWIQSKLTKIADYIGVVKHYLEYDKVVDNYPTNRKEEWTDADHDRQEKLAREIEKDNPGISKQKKMAFAGAQVNREKRKRNK